ncbi:hypothetical protein NQ109_28585 [Priestia megaterium]|uniref:hypothetical protein n=1 Tax=Priestia megaterium TaxID=1404 RepID=UPI00215A697B|nr:hypothetical protein [Priestia megaterium]MCR8866887.1 hypothetical protein [Priestia megaterium]
MKKILNYLTDIKLSNSKGFSAKELEDRAIFMGVMAEILLSRELFSKNSDLRIFIKNIFNLEPLEYLFRSRTLLLSRVIRIIESSEKDELRNYISRVSSYIDKTYAADSDEEILNKQKSYKKNKKKNTVEMIDSWRKVINKDND